MTTKAIITGLATAVIFYFVIITGVAIVKRADTNSHVKPQRITVIVTPIASPSATLAPTSPYTLKKPIATLTPKPIVK